MKLKDTCSLEENYDQPRQYLKKQRHYFANSIHLVKAMAFPAVMYGCESWTINLILQSWVLKNWCFWTVVLEKTLESPLDCKEINKSILKEISSEYSLEGLMLKLKLQCFGRLMQRTDSLEKTLMLGKIEGRRRRGRQRMRWLDGITYNHEMDGHEFEQALGVGDGQGSLVCFSSWGHKESAMTEWLNWTETLKDI